MTSIKIFRLMNDSLKQLHLKKHKRLATGLLLLMAIIYIVMIVLMQRTPQTWMGYVKAFSEAGMVGALADWFAVTALFRYPMGIKIPHTNLINNNKDALGKNLGDFVSDNFLTATTIRPYIDKLSLSEYLKEWLSSSKNQEIIITECNKLIRKIVHNLDDDAIARFLAQKGFELTGEIRLEKLAGTALLYLLEHREHDRLLDILLPQAQFYVENNRELIYKKVVEKQPILGLIGGKSVTNQLISGITTFLQEIEDNKNHEIRRELTEKLYQVVEDLNQKDNWKEQFDQIKEEFITKERVYEYATDIWLRLKNEMLEKLNDENAMFNQYLRQNILKMIDHFKEDEILQLNIDRYVRQYVYKMVLRNSKEVGIIITNTIKKWDGDEMSQKLELEVGKDLQYIRINGTLVGGLVGLLIYTLTHLFL